MSHLAAYTNDLYELRFSPMCKPAAEVANLTRLESHTTRGRTMMLWRIAAGMAEWGPREAELIYESTLDSISEAFDVFHYPVSQYMLKARADIWEAGLAPAPVRRVVEESANAGAGTPPTQAETLLLAGEIAQLGDDSLLKPIGRALEKSSLNAPAWVAQTGALAYALGAWDVAREQAETIRDGLKTGGTHTIIADGPETAWALTKIYPALGVEWPEQVTVKLLSTVLSEGDNKADGASKLGPAMVHDSRPACLLADHMATNLAILPGYLDDEAAFGEGEVYTAPRRLLDALGVERIFGTWTRSLAKSSGADDGLWLTYPRLAAGLAGQRLDYATQLGAASIVTDSPLAAAYLTRYTSGRDIKVKLLAELLST